MSKKPNRVFIKQTAKGVSIYNIKTKKLIDKAEDVGVFFLKRKKWGKIEGYTGYIQTELTNKFLDHLSNCNPYSMGMLLRNPEYYGFHYSVVNNKDIVVYRFWYPEDDVTGIKGLSNAEFPNR